jgi:hypothetical protein
MNCISNYKGIRNLVLLALTLSLALPVMASEIKIDLRTALNGPVFNGEQPSGKAEFQMENGAKRFTVEVDNINLPNGTIVSVLVNGSRVGLIKLANQGGTLFLSTGAGQTVPNITVGSTVAVNFSTTKILGGKF